MTKAKAKAKPLRVQMREGETEAAAMARLMVDPFLRHGIVGSALSDKMVGKLPGEPGFDDFSKAIRAKAVDNATGVKPLASALLSAQALSLDALFTELSRRATMNMGEYPQSAERYARLAFKAQSNCRASLEALAKLHQPREQTVRHVHVNEGGQAIVAEEFHQHRGGSKNEKLDEQSHATKALSKCASLSSPNSLGHAVPITGCIGEEALQDARGNQPRCSKGQS
jgi:hypothetical protein